MYALQSVAIKNTIPLAEAEAHYKKITKKKPRKVREEGEWWRFRYMPPTRFKKGSFRTKVVNDNIHLIFGELEGKHAKLEGRGLFDYFTKAYDYVANKASDAFSYVKNAVSITDYSATTKKLLEEYGKNEITRMTLRRVPISFAIDLALQGVSAGKWEELKAKYGFDKFFHLSLVVYLKNAYEKSALRVGRKIPKQLSVEKLEVVSVNERVEPVEGQEEQEVPIPKGQKITINEMFEKTKRRMGETAFFSYSALGANNCQDFVANLLQSEGLYREPEKEFVFQDLSELAKELPESTLAISQGITHLGALANKYLGVGGAKNEVIIPKEEFVKEHKHLVGLLKKSDDPALQKEADIQAKELKGELEGGTHRENVLKKWKLEDKGYSLAELASITGVPEKTLQEVYNRGIGAYTAPGGGVAKSVRLKGSYMKNVSAPASKKLSKENWAFARVYSYLDGNPSHDNDLRKNVGGAKVGLNDLLHPDDIVILNGMEQSGGAKRFKYLGGTQQSGFIQAMMGRESNNPEVQAKFQERIDKRNEQVAPKRARGDKRVKDGELTKDFLNEQKFQSSTITDGFDINKMSKTTHDLLRHKKLLTVEEAIKRFYDFLKKHAPQHQPLTNRPDKPLINYRGAYDIPGMFDLFIEEEDVKVEDEKDENDGKYDEPEPEKYKELFDLIRQSNEDRLGKNFTDKEISRMVHLFRYYKLDDDAPDLPDISPTTQKRLYSLRFMTEKERMGKEMTLEDLKEMERKEKEAKDKQEEYERKSKEEQERMKNITPAQRQAMSDYLLEQRRKKEKK